MPIHTRIKKLTLPFAHKTKGGALYVAVIVSLLIGISLLLFILLGGYNQRTVTMLVQQHQLRRSLQAAVQLAQSVYFDESHNNRWIPNGSSTDSVKIKKSYWGAFTLLSTMARNRHVQLATAGIYGTYMSADTGLVLTDNGRPLGLSGSIVFRANCYLPAAGIRPAYIEGQSYVGDASNSAFVKAAPAQLPEADRNLIAGLSNQKNNLDSETDSLVNTLPQVFNNPFSRKTVTCILSATRLSSCSYKNNIRLVADEVEIDSSCHLENVVVACKKARFAKGFIGRVHVIASDSIIAEKDCRFFFPSSFSLLGDDNPQTGLNCIELKQGSVFFGALLAFAVQRAQKPSVLIRLEAGCEVNGLVYSDNFLHLQGVANANVYAGKLLIKTPSSVYENHLLSCEINPLKCAHTMAVPALFKTGRQICCETIN